MSPYVSSILDEFNRSLPATRKHLERLPEDKLLWRPAEKSLTLGALGLHIAEAPPGVSSLVLQDTFDVSTGPRFSEPTSVDHILVAFYSGAETARENLAKADTLPMEANIVFTAGDTIVFEIPRGLFLRDIFLNHTYHHRGQLGVYLRLLGVPVPSTFGPSADESVM